MRRLGHNESPTADSTASGLGFVLPRFILVVLLAAGFLFFLGVRAALADGGLGGVTDPVVGSGQTEDSDGSGVVNAVVEPVTDLTEQEPEETDDESNEDKSQTSSADSEATDSKQPDPAPTEDATADTQVRDSTKSAAPQTNDSTAEPANGDDGSDSQSAAPRNQEQPRDASSQDKSVVGAVEDAANTVVSDIKPASGDDGSDSQSAAPRNPEQPRDASSQGVISSVVDAANTAVSDIKPTNSADIDLTEVSDTVATTSQATESVTGTLVDATDDTTRMVSDVADVVSGTTQMVGKTGSGVADISAIADVTGSPAVADVADLGGELVGGLTGPLENTLNAVSSDVEQVGGLLDVTIESVATSVDEVTSFTAVTVDEILATAADLVETTTSDVEESLAGLPPDEPVVEIIARDVIDESSVVTETSQRLLPPVAPEHVHPTKSGTNQPQAGAPNSSHDMVEGEARSMPAPPIPSVEEVLAHRLNQAAAGGGFDHGTDSTMSSSETPATLASTTSQGFGFFVVLAAMGLLALRMSRWLRLRPVLWRRYALAAAIDRPG